MAEPSGQLGRPAAGTPSPTPTPRAPARKEEPKRRRIGGGLFASATADVVLPGAESAAPARPVAPGSVKANRKAELDPVVAAMMPPRQNSRIGTPLSGFNRALATPIAKLFGVLGFAPGQLSIQSLTVTVLAMATAADGLPGHLLAGAAMVYVALLLDRADTVLAERKGTPGPWTLFLGVVADRLVELALVTGLAVLAVRGIEHPLAPWLVLPGPGLPILVAAAGGTWLVRRGVEQTAETLLLRTHLIATRRLPGPMAVARTRPVRPLIGAIVGRDESIVIFAAGIALGQIAVAAVALLIAQGLGLIEAIVLFHLRLREPEVEASRMLGPGYP